MSNAWIIFDQSIILECYDLFVDFVSTIFVDEQYLLEEFWEDININYLFNNVIQPLFQNYFVNKKYIFKLIHCILSVGCITNFTCYLKSLNLIVTPLDLVDDYVYLYIIIIYFNRSQVFSQIKSNYTHQLIITIT